MIPQYNVLTEKEIRIIHDNSMRILEEIGVVFEYEPACEVFRKKGMKVDDNRVYFKRGFVEEMVKCAPAEFTLHARNPKHNLVCGGNNVIYMPGYGAPFILEPGRKKRNATKKDYDNFVKLAGASRHLHMTGGNVVEPTDLPESTRHLQMTLSHILNSDKCFMGSSLGYHNAMDTIEMTAILHGRMEVIRKKPALICLINSLTPLKFDARMLGAQMAYAETGQAVVIASLVMSGSTGPATLAGALSLQNAEVLAGIALSQAINPGTPVVYGSTSAIADMKSILLSIGNPEGALFTSASAQLARWYGVPSRGGGGLSDSKEADIQAGYESMMTLFAASLSGINFVLHTAGILQFFSAMSYEKFIVDDEMAGMILRYREGFDTSDEEKLAFDVIRDVGPGGNFLTAEHTVMNFREEFFLPVFADKAQFDDNWTASYTAPEMRARKIWQERLASYTPPALDAGIRENLEAFTAKRERDILKRPEG
ncbi:MAG: trimethylamine methyltransferase family protein [Spirochaetaceae bacterium]|jgi:trimethylamine--corrinoid protein Co-methyltransferase|nr:trimethylamine methyltransferase family protein [Spirochaetaceae bacterium]